MKSEEPALNRIIKEPMRLALALAQLGQHTVSPNPMVGAVILQNSRLVGYGYHVYKGGSHAESKAIDMAAAKAEGATLYLNLEPCCHYGATPPCVDKIIAAKIAEVHFSSIDPNPLMQGKSITKLEQAGIKVVIGNLKEAAEQLNKRFYHYMSYKRPFVIAKWAMTMDGKMSAKQDSKWITNQEARKKVHYLRNSVDAILVGAHTAIKDNPSLNVRDVDLPIIRQPLKFILGRSSDQLPLDCNLFTINPDKTYLVNSSAKKEILQNMGVNFIKALDLNDLLKQMANLSITSLLVEGGEYTLAKFLQADLINEFYCYIAAKFAASGNTSSLLNEDMEINFMKDAKQAKFTNMEFIGNDVLIQGRF